MDIDFRNSSIGEVTGTILSGKMDDYNSFDDPEIVMEKNFENFESSGNMLKVALPPCSLVSLRIKLS